MLHVTNRKNLYALLARLFTYPDPELVATLQEGAAEQAVGSLPVDPPPPLAQSRALQELEVAYTDLFINRLGGAPAPPYGSVYLDQDGQLMGQSARSAAEAYRAEGLSIAAGGEPPDFLSTELEFLYYLVEQEEAALTSREVDKARSASARQADFCRALLHPWVPVFCKRVADDAQAHPFYRWACEVLIQFCRMEEKWLERLH